MKFSGRTWMSLGIMVIVAWGVIKALSWPLTTALFPVVIGIPVFILAASELVSSLSKSGKKDIKAPAKSAVLKKEKSERIPLRKDVFAFVLVLSFFFLILLVGFPIAVPLFVFLYMKIYGREKWGLSAGLAAAAWGGFYGLFVLVSNIHFDEGWVQQGLRALGIL